MRTSFGELATRPDTFDRRVERSVDVGFQEPSVKKTLLDSARQLVSRIHELIHTGIG